MSAAPTSFRHAGSPEKSAAILMAALAGRVAASLALTVLLGQSLSDGDFGFFVLVGTVFALTYDLTDLGTGNLAVRNAASGNHSECHMLECLLGLRLVLSGVAAAACVGLALLQYTLPHRLALVATSAVLMFSYFSAFNTVFQLRQAQLGPAFVNIWMQVFTVAAAVVLLWINTPGIGFALLILIREATVLIINRALAIRLLNYTPHARFTRVGMQMFVGPAFLVAISTLCYHLQFHGGIFVVHLFRPEPELGAFAAALRPMAPFLIVPWLLIMPMMPLLSWLAKARSVEFSRQVRGTLHLAIGVGAVIGVAAIQLAPAVLEFLFGGKFNTGALDSVSAFRWLAVSLALSFVIAGMATALIALGQERRLMFLSIGSLVAGLVADWALLPHFRFTGAAAATAASSLLLTIGGLVLLRWSLDGIAVDRQLVVFLVPAGVLFLTLELVSGGAVFQLAAGGALTGLALFTLWRLPAVAQYRAQQALLSALASPGRTGDAIRQTDA
jgi:O-antigen/teichoic acid export membrane protein